LVTIGCTITFEGDALDAQNMPDLADVAGVQSRPARGDALATAWIAAGYQPGGDTHKQTEGRVLRNGLRFRMSNAGTGLSGRTGRSSAEHGRLLQRHVVGPAVGLAVIAAVICVQPAAAQSTIFNIPSTDTVAPAKVYFEFDYLPQAPSYNEGGLQTFTPRLVFGATSRLEVGANFSNTHVADGGGTYSLFQPDAKFKFYANDDQGLAATAGLVGYFAMNHRDEIDNKDFGQVYGNVSKKFKSGARITGGLWASMGLTDNTGGVLAGYEQPLTSKISFVADWFSGKNFWGYFTPGVSFTLPGNGLLNIGYSIGNNAYNNDNGNDTHNKAVFTYYGITFP
jgi:hypothetical protein